MKQLMVMFKKLSRIIKGKTSPLIVIVFGQALLNRNWILHVGGFSAYSVHLVYAWSSRAGLVQNQPNQDFSSLFWYQTDPPT